MTDHGASSSTVQPGVGSLEELYHEAPCGYVSSLPDGTVLAANRTFLAWTGYDEEKILGRRLQDLLTAGGRIYHETHLAPMLRMQGSVREVALEVVCADGQRLPVLVNSVLREEAGREVVRTVLIDATERRAYEQELVRARQLAEEAEARASSLARTLQASLVPPSLPKIPGIEIASIYLPAGEEVGGDFYDIFQLGEGAWGLGLGDVEGKGAEAAAVTALARYTVRAAAVRDPEPSAVLAALNDALLLDPGERFCTVVYGALDVQPGTGATLSFASAGHPLPILVPNLGEPRPVGRPGTLAGAFRRAFTVAPTKITLERGDLMLVYTDGLIEGRGDTGVAGEERLLETLSLLGDQPVPDIVRALSEAAEVGARDDVAIVALRVV